MYIENTIDIETDLENRFFDDFDDGIDYDKWEIANYSWGAYSNGGVIPENIFWDKEKSCVTIRALGQYYKKNEVSGVGDITDGSYTGGVLVYRKPVESGRYEARIRVAPRPGCICALWCYSEIDSTHAPEITMEISTGYPYNKVIIYVDSGTGNGITDKTIEASGLFDGEYHVIGFDWYCGTSTTDGDHTQDLVFIRFFIDNEVIYTLSSQGEPNFDLIPKPDMRLFVGLRVPNNANLAGKAEFENTYMDIDYVRYQGWDYGDGYQYLTQRNFSLPKVAGTDKYPISSTPKWRRNLFPNGSLKYTDGFSTINSTLENGKLILSQSISIDYTLEAILVGAFKGRQVDIEIDYESTGENGIDLFRYNIFNTKNLLDSINLPKTTSRTIYKQNVLLNFNSFDYAIHFDFWTPDGILTLYGIFIGFIEGNEYDLRLDGKVINKLNGRKINNLYINGIPYKIKEEN